MRRYRWLMISSLGLAPGWVAPPAQQVPVRRLAVEMRILSSDSMPQAQLTGVSDFVVAPDGNVFAFDARGCDFGCFRVYDATGRFVRSFGRLGDGPGEFTTNTDILLAAGDSVIIHDRMKGSFHTFRRNGSLVRSARGAKLGQGGERTLRGYLGEGRLLTEISYYRWPVWDSSAIRITDFTARDVARIAGWKAYNFLSVPEMRFNSLYQPFFPRPQAAQDPNAGRALAALPSAAFGGQPGQVKLVLMNANGIQSERIINVGARRLTDAVRDEWIRTEFGYREAAIRASGRPRAELERRLREQLFTPAYIPEIDRAMLGGDGSIWLKLHGANDWLVVSATGAMTARVQVPADVMVKQVSLDRLWGVASDADGVSIIVRYKVS